MSAVTTPDQKLDRYITHPGMIPVTYQEFIPYSLARRVFSRSKYKQEPLLYIR